MWSRIRPGSGADEAARARAFESLARRYWRPIAGTIRSRFARSDDEAREATQDFFLWMLEQGFLERADPERGSFRGFVKKSLANFLHDRERGRRTLKRGGGVRFVPLEGAGERSGEGAGEPLELPDSNARSPAEALDDLWRRSVLAQALDELERELRGRGKNQAFEVFRAFFLSGEEPDYAELARAHGIGEADVSNRLSFAKRRFRAHLRSAVLETVQRDEDLRAELAAELGEL